MSQGLVSLLWFLAILVLIPVTLWLLKRTPMGGAAGHGVLKSIAALPLSTSQRLLTVEVGQGDERRWLVLGVTPHSITTLHTMAPQADAPAAPEGTQPTPPGFAALLAKIRPGAPR
jgi:flagellar protein FliO/FliZ